MNEKQLVQKLRRQAEKCTYNKTVNVLRRAADCLVEQRKDTGVVDKNFDRIFVGDKVRLFAQRGTVVFECGAYGIGIHPSIDWDRLEKEIPVVTGCRNQPYFCYNDNFISFWELLSNFNGEEDCCDVVEIIRQKESEEYV